MKICCPSILLLIFLCANVSFFKLFNKLYWIISLQTNTLHVMKSCLSNPNVSLLWHIGLGYWYLERYHFRWFISFWPLFNLIVAINVCRLLYRALQTYQSVYNNTFWWRKCFRGILFLTVHCLIPTYAKLRVQNKTLIKIN